MPKGPRQLLARIQLLVNHEEAMNHYVWKHSTQKDPYTDQEILSSATGIDETIRGAWANGWPPAWTKARAASGL